MNAQRLTDELLVHWLEYGTDLLDHDTQDAILGELIEARATVASLRETLGRVEAVLGEYLDPDDADIECREDVWRFIRDLRAALEGGDI